MSKDVNIIFGAPGTGKTTTLLNHIEDAINDGINPRRIAFLTFTKKAANEAIDRAVKRFNLEREDFPYFRTIHSLAFKLLNLSTKQVFQKKNYDEVSNELGFIINRDKINSDHFVLDIDDIGMKAFNIYLLSKARQESLYTTWERCHHLGLAFSYVKMVEHAIKEYKNKHNLYEYHDFLEKCKDNIDVDIFIIDEAQDLTRQQWDFVNVVSENAKKIIIAGDDDQSIYGWNGADVNHFLNIDSEVTVLPITYRLPKKIHDFSNTIISNVLDRKPKNITPVIDKGGRIEWIHNLDGINFDSGEWLLLARTNYQLKFLVNLMRERGHVYKHKDKWSNDESYIKAIIDFHKLKEGKCIKYSQAKRLAKYIRDVDVDKLDPNRIYNKKDFFIDDNTKWNNKLDGIEFEDIQYLRNVISKRESLIHPGRITISTIHGAKGGEADNVFLYVKANKRLQENLRYNRDEEIRTWYVGITRAQENLYFYGDEDFFKSL